MVYIEDVNDKLIVIRNVSLDGIEEPYRFIKALNKLGNCPPSVIDFSIQDFISDTEYRYLISNVRSLNKLEFFNTTTSFTFVNIVKNNEYYNWLIHFGCTDYTRVSVYKCITNNSITNKLDNYANYCKLKLIQLSKEDILNVRRKQF